MNVVNRNKNEWVRPWNIEKFDDLYNRDDRFFAVVIKGVIAWFNKNIVMYNKPINHFILDTGSAYLYVENNGYEYTINETTGEDMMYMQMPRCIIEVSNISFPQEELTSPFSRGNYERRSGNNIKGFNAEIRRLPVEISLNLKYVFSNFNESIVVLQELIDKIIYQHYFRITYLGQIIQCSIEFPADTNPEINQIDMTSVDVNQKNLTLDVKVCTNYPIINERTEIATNAIISSFGGFVGYNNNDIIDFSGLDINGDGKLTEWDIQWIIDYIRNHMPYNPLFDFNGDGVLDEKDIAILLWLWKLLIKYDIDGNMKIDDRDKQSIKDDIYNGDKTKQDIIDYNNFVDEWKDSVPFSTKKVQNALYIHDIDPNNPKSQIIDTEKWIFDNSDTIVKDNINDTNENNQD